MALTKSPECARHFKRHLLNVCHSQEDPPGSTDVWAQPNSEPPHTPQIQTQHVAQKRKINHTHLVLNSENTFTELLRRLRSRLEDCLDYSQSIARKSVAQTGSLPSVLGARLRQQQPHPFIRIVFCFPLIQLQGPLI